MSSTPTEDIFHGADTKASKSIPPGPRKSAKRKLDAINGATTPADLRVPRSNNLEELKGKRTGTWSIRVNDQCRITFKFAGGQATNVIIEDYHP